MHSRAHPSYALATDIVRSVPAAFRQPRSRSRATSSGFPLGTLSGDGAGAATAAAAAAKKGAESTKSMAAGAGRSRSPISSFLAK